MKARRRLTSDAQFDAVFRDGRHVRSERFKLIFMLNGEGASRLGIVIRKKEVKLSSRRNRLRRLIKEAFRKTKHNLNGVYDIVMYSLAENASLKLKDVELELLNLYKKAGVSR